MRCLTESECWTLLEGWGGRWDEEGQLRISGADRHECEIVSTSNLHQIQTVVNATLPWTKCLLWITQTEIWTSSENLHLFYRLRASYNENRLIEEAPAHYFHAYEFADLVTFMQVGVINGWDMYLFPWQDYCRVFHSHDEYFLFSFSDEASRDDFVRSINE